ncbi:MAG: hypothetical protein AAB383_03430 [Patescibacteria group bacterium]
MKDTVLVTMNYIISFLGLLAVIGVFIGIPGGIVLLVTGLNNKDPKAKKRRIIWGIALIVLPPLVIIGTLIAFAMVNVILSGA